MKFRNPFKKQRQEGPVRDDQFDEAETVANVKGEPSEGPDGRRFHDTALAAKGEPSARPERPRYGGEDGDFVKGGSPEGRVQRPRFGGENEGEFVRGQPTEPSTQAYVSTNDAMKKVPFGFKGDEGSTLLPDSAGQAIRGAGPGEQVVESLGTKYTMVAETDEVLDNLVDS